jgi:uncharacterized membrane-anchored protein
MPTIAREIGQRPNQLSMKQFLLLLLLVSSLALQAETKEEALTKDYQAKIKQLESKLSFRTGEISLGGDLAKLNVPKEFRFLGPDDANTVLTKLWGNPDGEKPLGMLLPADVSPLSSDCWGVIITYSDEGYVKDSDADSIDYTKLLKQMKESSKASNEERRKEGYPEVELVGWATSPRYDKATHKLYWAKELKFSDSKENTLNYNIRVLGRRGFLELNAVADINDLKKIEEHTPQIVGMVDFQNGNRYADFDSKNDKVAAYGLAALVAGGIAAKAGFFKLLWVGILAMKKFIIIGVVALGGLLKKIFSRKESKG